MVALEQTTLTPLSGSVGDYPYHEGNHLLVFTQAFAYGDESGITKEDEWCLLLGYVASPRTWKSFNKKWRARISREGLPESHAFHLFNPNHEDSPFREWSSTRILSFLRDLLSIIGTHQIRPIGSAIDAVAFRSLSEEHRRFLTGAKVGLSTGLSRDGFYAHAKLRGTGAPTKPYYAAMYNFIIEAVLQSNSASEVHFILDKNTDFAPHATTIYREIKEEVPPPGRTSEMLGDLTFSDSHKRNREGLQAADLYAYVWRQRLKARPLKGHVQVAFDALTRNKPSIRVFRKDDLERVASHGQDWLYQAVGDEADRLGASQNPDDYKIWV